MTDWASGMSSASLVTLGWALLLALATCMGQLLFRWTGLPRMVGYTLVGGLAGALGFSGASWPMQGLTLLVLQLGMTLALFEAGTRLPFRWLRHNPMVLVQSLLEAVLTFVGSYFLLRALGESPAVANMVAMVAVAASPATLLRLVHDLRAAGPVTDRALVLASLNNLYALALGGAMAAQASPDLLGWAAVWPPVRLLALSLALAVVLALLIHLAWRLLRDSPDSVALLVLAVLTASVTVADQLHASAPLAALLAGAVLRHAPVRPLSWQRRLEANGNPLLLFLFVLVAMLAAQQSWQVDAMLAVAALMGLRLLTKVGGVVLGSWRSGMGPKKSVWLGLTLMPMSATALLLTSQFASQHTQGARVSAIALPLILLFELLGALCAAWAMRAAHETASAGTEGRHDT